MFDGHERNHPKNHEVESVNLTISSKTLTKRGRIRRPPIQFERKSTKRVQMDKRD